MQKTITRPVCCDACRVTMRDNPTDPDTLAPLYTLCRPCAEEVREMFQLLEERENAPMEGSYA